MTNEPNVGFSNKAGLAPPGMYYWPPGFGGSTEEKLVGKYIPYPHVPGATPHEENPGDLENK
jgi:hypothetical protein